MNFTYFFSLFECGDRNIEVTKVACVLFLLGSAVLNKWASLYFSNYLFSSFTISMQFRKGNGLCSKEDGGGAPRI